MEKEILEFSEWMSKEIKANEYKGNWKEWASIDKTKVIDEFEHHKRKLMMELRNSDGNIKISNIREYLADTANCLLFIGYYYKLFKIQKNEN